ncbi:MAG TPA: hypothetical protein VLA34_11435, partial [Candidatus Krumholzibacterium sp.]|nr:hypothetical protein [Candidatus Krumholzibacterium sp.]
MEMTYHLYRLWNTTKAIREYVWVKSSDPAPVVSIDNPTDSFLAAVLVRKSSEPVGGQAGLEVYKSIKNGAIDKRTQELIAEGFSFDGKTFSMSANAQRNWIALRANSDLLTWPVSITTIDDDEYSLSLANLPAFEGAGMAAGAGHYNSGRALKLQVNAATDKA